MNTNLTFAAALAQLSAASATSVRLLEKPSFDISVYKPVRHDPQGPHKRDELYVIASGSGHFTCDGSTESFAVGDAFFVSAGVEHRFVDFSADFWTWVIFFGQRPAKQI